jgi:hypothetical protein
VYKVLPLHYNLLMKITLKASNKYTLFLKIHECFGHCTLPQYFSCHALKTGSLHLQAEGTWWRWEGKILFWPTYHYCCVLPINNILVIYSRNYQKFNLIMPRIILICALYLITNFTFYSYSKWLMDLRNVCTCACLCV